MGVSINRSEYHSSTFIVTLHEGWTWHDIERAHDDIQRLSAGEKPVHILTEVAGPINIPFDVDKLAKPWLKQHAEFHGGMLIFITRWNMVKSLVKLISESMGNQLSFVYFASSHEEAHAIIQQSEVV